MRRLGAWLACVGLVAATAVAVTGDATPGRPDPYPLDGVLRLQDVQVLGTHNSYHVRPDRPVLPLEPANYAHPPLDVQLAKEHVRSLEIDVFNEPSVPVMHSIMVDEQSNCPRLAACLRTVQAWSKANPGHLPVTIFVETKSIPTTKNKKSRQLIHLYAGVHSLANWDGAGLARVDATVKRVFGKMLLTPDEVRGKRATLRDAIVRDGWPTLRRTRGKVLVVLNAGKRLRDVYRKGAPSLQHKSMFVVSAPGGSVGRGHLAGHAGRADVRVAREGPLPRADPGRRRGRRGPRRQPAPGDGRARERRDDRGDRLPRPRSRRSARSGSTSPARPSPAATRSPRPKQCRNTALENPAGLREP